MISKWKTITTAGVASLLVASQILSVSADTADDIAYLEQQQAQANAELEYVQETINDLEVQKNDLLAQIDEYDTELVSTITTINLLDSQIVEKEDELVQTGKDLEAAEEDADQQYEAMKERIRYLYEEGGDAGWAAMLLVEGVGISNILDKADYTQQLYDYDRKELDAYAESIQLVEDLQEQQTQQKAALETMKVADFEHFQHLGHGQARFGGARLVHRLVEDGRNLVAGAENLEDGAVVFRDNLVRAFQQNAVRRGLGGGLGDRFGLAFCLRGRGGGERLFHGTHPWGHTVSWVP